MNQWENQFKQHPVHTEMVELEKLIQNSAPPVPEDQQVDGYNRLLAVIQLAFSYLKSLSPYFTSRDILDKLHNAFANIRGQLTNYLKSKNAAHLTNANSHADQLLSIIPINDRIITQEGFTSLLNDLQRSINSLVISLTTTASEYSDSVKSLETKNENLQKRIDQQDSHTNAQKERIDKAIAEFQTQFSEADQARRKQIEETERQHNNQFATFRDDISNQIKSLIEQKQAEAITIFQSFKEEARKIVTELEAKRKEATNLLQVTANILVTGDYETLAGQERKAANSWRITAVCCMIGVAVAAALIVEMSLKDNTINWKMIIFRYATAAILLFPALYAMAESTHHRKMEHKYRRLQLELASIDPFLESLPKDKRDELKKTLADRIFAQPEPMEANESIGAKQLVGIVEKAVDNLTSKR